MIVKLAPQIRARERSPPSVRRCDRDGRSWRATGPGFTTKGDRVDSELVRVEPTENLWDQRGVREEDGIIQIGLTEDEIDDVWDRIESFLDDIDRGRYTTF